MAKDNNESWPHWTAKLLKHLANGDIDAAANLLACCVSQPDFTAVDTAGHDAMFKHPDVLPHAKALWGKMRPLITSSCRRAVRKEVVAAGWVLK